MEIDGSIAWCRSHTSIVFIDGEQLVDQLRYTDGIARLESSSIRSVGAFMSPQSDARTNSTTRYSFRYSFLRGSSSRFSPWRCHNLIVIFLLRDESPYCKIVVGLDENCTMRFCRFAFADNAGGCDGLITARLFRYSYRIQVKFGFEITIYNHI